MQKLNDLKKIKIPIIQRDYVQGRGDVKSDEVRKNFLNDLFNALKNNKNFHLDFVYGNYDDKGFFVPIDGQQRLTTLFLLHWYFSKKENQELKVELTYETRVSARSFCEKIRDFEIDFAQESISKQIKNSKKFSPYWDYDPTIKSMLKVLDDIHHNSKNIKLSDLEVISFEVFELKGFGEIQAEELYRKMNSRGKSLTAFENFKTIFEQIAHKKSKEQYKAIALKFEKKWSDEFWENNSGCEIIDESFMNFVYFVTEMRSYELGKSVEEVKNFNSFIYLREFYNNEKNFDFLVQKLDNLREIKMLSEYVAKNFKFFVPTVNFFVPTVNLFDEIIKDKLSIVNKILTYLLINCLDESKILDLLRIARNEMHRNRALTNGEIRYQENIVRNDIENYLKNFLQLIDSSIMPYEKLLTFDILKHEKEKADLIINQGFRKEVLALEDYMYLKGDLRILLQINSDIKYLHQKIIMENVVENKDFIRSLLSIDDFALWRGIVYGGEKYYFGQKKNFEILFTENSFLKDNLKIYKEFFEKIKTSSLENLIEDKLKEYSSQTKDWIYYFLQYPKILQEGSLSNIFGWMNFNGDHIEKLENRTRITNKHINVYILALLHEIGEEIDFGKLEYGDNGNSIYTYKRKKIKVQDKHLCIGNEKFPLFTKQDAIEEAIKILKT